MYVRNISQLNLFKITKKHEKLIDKKYTSKIKAPIYEPRERNPFLYELANTFKSSQLIREIKSSSVTEEEKAFLILAAQRHIVFDFEKIADYYAHASTEMQELMERSALIIIDFDKAIEYGFVKLSKRITSQFIEDQNNE